MTRLEITFVFLFTILLNVEVRLLADSLQSTSKVKYEKVQHHSPGL